MERYFLLCANRDEWDMISIPKDDEIFNLVKCIIEKLGNKTVMFISSGGLEYSVGLIENESLVHSLLEEIESYDYEESDEIYIKLKKLSELLGVDLIINKEE